MDSSADAAPLVPGQVLENKYRVSRALGGGAMGIVYEAYHLLLQKSVAIKVLRPELAALEELRDRFEAEARAAAAIGHPNIVTVTDMGQTPAGALYFVMDRLRGETLGERLERQGKLDVASAARIVLEVLGGLEAAHALRLVHRDLKPDNIFLARPPGGREIAKILDFGIAKALASVGRRNQGTRIGTTVGTPMYMAPEQAVGDPDIDARADLYSLGVILYQVLAGRPPFDGKDAVSVLGAVMTETPPSLGSLCPAAPHELVRLVESAMNRDRDLRPATAGDFIARLQEATSALPRPSTGPQPAYDTGKLSNAFDTGVLVDLTGKELPAAPTLLAPPPTIAAVDAFTAPIDDTAALLPDTPAPAVIAPAEPPVARRRGKALWLLALPVAAAAGFLLWPRGSTPDAATAAPAHPTVLVQFDARAGSQLFLDGSPLPANPIALGTGELHTVTAVAGGQVVGTEKFLVDQAKTVRVRTGRR